MITNGTRWHRYPFGCPAGFLLAGIGAASSSRVAFYCADSVGMFHTFKEVLVSVDGGKSEHLAGRRAPIEGDPGGFAVPPGRPGTFTLAVISAALDYVAGSGDGGRTWASTTISRTSGGANLGSLAYVSRNVGWLVVKQLGGQNRLLRTTDAGSGWQAVAF